ncbi:MAG TPA: hypothetical protein VFQ61_34865, partial [Polyangiaceae bacterium]|nr:hypothetical protein [Polyangiaceae bacterium]
MRLRTLHRALLGFAFGPLLGCGGDTSPRKGQIMLALQTDMNIPTDVSHVRIVVLKNGALKFDQKYRVGKDGEEIPATLGIIASDNASDTTEVRVLSYQGSKVRTLNRVVTTIPTNRVATLNVPIQWLCDGQVKSSDAAADGFDSSCDDPEAACIAGECRKVYVDSVTLPDFELADVTGGSAVPEEGLCYDTAACLDLGRDITPDAQCQIAVPKKLLPKLNVGLRLPKDGGGICGDAGNCYIPLDSNPDSGFRVVDGSKDPAIVALPKAACTKLASGDAAAVRVSDACVTKTPSIPTCGPWTSVGTRNPNKGPTAGSGASPGVEPGTGGAGGAGGEGTDATGGTVDSHT